MKKIKLILFPLMVSVMISAVCLSSCKKDNEAKESLNLPTIETVIYGDCDSELGIECPYCGGMIEPDHYHEHHFSPMQGDLLSDNLEWGSMYITNETGEVVPNNLGDIEHPFPVDYCENNLSDDIHVCRYCAEKIYHKHRVIYSVESGYDSYTSKWIHIGGGFMP